MYMPILIAELAWIHGVLCHTSGNWPHARHQTTHERAAKACQTRDV